MKQTIPADFTHPKHVQLFSRATVGLLSCFSILAVLSIAALSQMAGGGGGELQQKFAALKQAAAANQQRLHHYQWIETSQITLKGEAKPPSEKLCSYGPDGRVQKIPVGAPQEQQGRQGGKLKQRIIEKKKEEMQDYMQQVQSLLSLYVPPNPQKMQQAFQAHNVSINPGGGGVASLIFKNYAQPGDEMTIAFNTAAKKIQSLNVNTYMGEEKDAVTLAVTFASLADGTSYPQQTVLNATAKQIQVTTTNSNYQKLAQ